MQLVLGWGLFGFFFRADSQISFSDFISSSSLGVNKNKLGDIQLDSRGLSTYICEAFC